MEANDMIEAIRTGQVDALMVRDGQGHQLYTLKSADHSYRIFIEKMNEGAVTLDHGGIVVYCNSQFARMIGLPLSAVLGHPFNGFIAEQSKRSYLENFSYSWENDSKVEVLLKGDEGDLPAQLSFSTLILDGGVSLSVIITDLTLQKNAQRQLEKYNHELEKANHELELSNHDLQQFASVASHDLQEPLRKVQIYSHLIKEYEASLPPAIKNYLGRIIDSSTRMRTLIIDILNYSRLSAEMQFEYTDLNKLLRELEEDFELIIGDKQAVLHLERIPMMDVNRGQMRQVFQNIIGNSLKFSRPGVPPRITIRSKRIRDKFVDSTEDPNGPYCYISIEDNGIGFDEKYVSNVFALFERLHTKDRYEGTGIGLAIAKKIIEKHNGMIGAVSREGSGSEFRIILPIRQLIDDVVPATGAI